MNTIFMGTPDIAVPTLRRLIERGHEVRAVVTQPDRPKGRGNQVVSAPVKLCAVQYGLPVLQPEKIRAPAAQDAIRAYAPDVIVVVAYGQILPQTLLDIPRCGCVNVHASLLPKYRGAAPIQWAVIRGERETGVTTMLMDAGMDTGAILLQHPLPIRAEDTTATLFALMAEVGADLLIRTLDALEHGTVTPRPQQHDAATYAPLLTKGDGCIDWRQSARQIADRVRGCLLWPGAYTTCQGKTLKVRRVGVVEVDAAFPAAAPGMLVAIEKTEGFVVATGEGYLRMTDVQPENKKPMSGSDFCRGYRLTVGAQLGSD